MLTTTLAAIAGLTLLLVLRPTTKQMEAARRVAIARGDRRHVL